MASRIQQIANELLDTVEGEFDLMETLAVPLPIIVIAEILGVDAADRADFSRWSRDGALAFDPFLAPDVAKRALRSAEELHAYLTETAEARRLAPRDDLITQLVHARDGDHSLSSEELVDVVSLLLGAGNITTTDVIGNAALALLRHPDQYSMVAATPCMAAGAVEEALRFDSPVLLTDRIASHDTEVGGCPVRKGEWILLGLAAANRSEGDDFDITRTAHHQSFGGGTHFCPGAPLARLEAGLALSTLATRFPHLSLCEQKLDYHGAVGFRGLTELRVRP
jgi:cytochrome P450